MQSIYTQIPNDKTSDQVGGEQKTENKMRTSNQKQNRQLR